MNNPAKAKFLKLQELHLSGKHAEAAAALAAALRISPRDPNLLHLAAINAEALGDLPRAAMLLERATDARPDWMEAEFNLARILGAQNRYGEALTILKKLASTHPDMPEAWSGMAKMNHAVEDPFAALECWRKALRLAPHRHDWRGQYLLLRRILCEWGNDGSGVGAGLEGLPPHIVMALSDDPEAQKLAATRYCAQAFRRITPQPIASVRKDGRIRVGYLSSDFHAHATAFLMGGIFALHDRDNFEAFAYSYGVDDGSAARRRLAAEAEHFVDLSRMTAAQSAERIRADDIDVLIDLKGHTRGARLDILAHRPARKTAHWLGYPGTTGAPFVDFFIGDETTIPTGQEKFFTETVVRLPRCYQMNCGWRQANVPKTRREYGLPDEALVLAAFNQTYKITPEIFTIWCKALSQNPRAVLWLHQSMPAASDNLRRHASSYGISPERLVFAPQAAPDEHLARYACADLAVDTFPVGGHTTTGDALWSGVPVVSLAGKCFASRVAASVIAAVGIPHMVANSFDEYEGLLVDLINAPAKLEAARNALRTEPEAIQLFDAAGFTRDFESALRFMAAKP